MRICRWLAHDFRPRYSETSFDQRDVDGTFVHFRTRQYEGEICTRCGEQPPGTGPRDDALKG